MGDVCLDEHFSTNSGMSSYKGLVWLGNGNKEQVNGHKSMGRNYKIILVVRFSRQNLNTFASRLFTGHKVKLKTSQK